MSDVVKQCLFRWRQIGNTCAHVREQDGGYGSCCATCAFVSVVLERCRLSALRHPLVDVRDGSGF